MDQRAVPMKPPGRTSTVTQEPNESVRQLLVSYDIIQSPNERAARTLLGLRIVSACVHLDSLVSACDILTPELGIPVQKPTPSLQTG